MCGPVSLKETVVELKDDINSKKNISVEQTNDIAFMNFLLFIFLLFFSSYQNRKEDIFIKPCALSTRGLTAAAATILGNFYLNGFFLNIWYYFWELHLHFVISFTSACQHFWLNLL